MPVDTKAATDRLLRFLAVEGVTGQEAAIGRELTAALKESGVPAKAIRLDDANTRIPVPTERPATLSSTCPAAARCTTSRASCS
ncbi:hypothetical protein ACVWZ6_003756 [Bradyrhizobium sp. GM6.1]